MVGDATLAFMTMAERAFHERDKLRAALTELVAFIDRANDYELTHAHQYRAYIDARAELARGDETITSIDD